MMKGKKKILIDENAIPAIATLVVALAVLIMLFLPQLSVILEGKLYEYNWLNVGFGVQNKDATGVMQFKPSALILAYVTTFLGVLGAILTFLTVINVNGKPIIKSGARIIATVTAICFAITAVMAFLSIQISSINTVGLEGEEATQFIAKFKDKKTMFPAYSLGLGIFSAIGAVTSIGCVLLATLVKKQKSEVNEATN